MAIPLLLAPPPEGEGDDLEILPRLAHPGTNQSFTTSASKTYAMAARHRLVLSAAALCAAITACGSGGQTQMEVDGGVDAPNASVAIGVPAGTDGLDFAPLPPDGELRLESFGQGGIHVLLAIRCTGFGNRAFVMIRVTNLLTGAETISPAPVRPQLLLCRDADVCDLVPVLVMVGAVAEAGTDRNGLHVRITADVHNEAGIESSASQEAVFSTADL